MKLKLISLPFIILFLIAQLGCNKDDNNDENTNCNLVPDPGFCEAYFPKYYFDQEEGICKEFIWGGCDGTVPFDTIEECQVCACND